MHNKFNFNDARVRRRAASALAFVNTFASDSTPKHLSTRYIDQHLGQSQHALSKFLRNLLLTVHDHQFHWDNPRIPAEEACKQYLRNADGCRWLHNKLYPNDAVDQDLELVYKNKYVDQYSEELLSGQFKYEDKSQRQWHPLQHLPNKIRREQLARYGYSHIYDIKCAAPSIILHLARDIGVKLKHTSTMEDYILRRTKIRQQLSRDLGIPESDVKKLLTMLFNGAPVGFTNNNGKPLATTQLLRGDARIINAVKNHPYILNLRAEITRCWRKISNHQIDGEYVIPRRYHATGKKKRINSSDRWQLYFLYERSVMNVVTAYLDRQYARYLIEHDGWSSNIQIDLADLTAHVRSVSGISTIEFDYECYS
jgi:hypothetical protein